MNLPYEEVYTYQPAPVDPNKKDSAAAVIRFVDGAQDMARIQAFLDRLAERGIIYPTKATAFNSQVTSAELYLP